MKDKITNLDELVEATSQFLLTDIRNWYENGGYKGVFIPNLYFMDKKNDLFTIQYHANGKYLLQNQGNKEEISNNVGELLVITKDPNRILKIIKLIKECEDETTN